MRCFKSSRKQELAIDGLMNLKSKNLKQILEKHLLIIYQMMKGNQLISKATKIHSIEMLRKAKTNVMMTNNIYNQK